MSRANRTLPVWLAETMRSSDESMSAHECDSAKPTAASGAGPSAALRLALELAALIAILHILAACARQSIVPIPGAPMFISEGRGELRVSAWDIDECALVDIGTVDAASLRGWTLTVYDWAEEAKRGSGE